MRIYSTVACWSSKMTNLVQILTMRQFKMTNQHHLLAAGYGPRLTRWDPGTICARQLWGCSGFPALGCQRPTLCHRDAVHCLRFKSSRRKNAARTTTTEDSEDEEEHSREESDGEDELDNDPNVPEGYKDMEKHVQSFRYDMIMKAGLDVARNKIEDGLYDNKLWLNGQQVVKKSKKVKVGDTLDLIMSEDKEASTVQLKRVILRKVLWESPDEEKYKVALRRWKVLQLPAEEVFKSNSEQD